MNRNNKRTIWLVLPSVGLMFGSGCGGGTPEPPAARAKMSIAKPTTAAADSLGPSSGSRGAQAVQKSIADSSTKSAAVQPSASAFSIVAETPRARLAQVRPIPMADAPEIKIPESKTSFMADPLSLVCDPPPPNSDAQKTTAEIRAPDSGIASRAASPMRIRLGETSTKAPAPTAILEFGPVPTKESSSLKVCPLASNPVDVSKPEVVVHPTAAPRPAEALQPSAAAQPSIVVSASRPTEPPVVERSIVLAPLKSAQKVTEALTVNDTAAERPIVSPPRESSVTSTERDAVGDGPMIAPPQATVESQVVERRAVSPPPSPTETPKVKDDFVDRPMVPPSRNDVQPPVVERVNVAARPILPASPPVEMKAESEQIELAMPVRSPELMAICQKADAINRHAFELAQHGAVFSARLEYMHSLEVIAEALDAQRGTRIHQRMLIAGFKAMEEADDFASQHILAGGERNVAETVRSHQTPVVKSEPKPDWTTQAAMSRYLTYSQEQLAGALANLPPASAALFGLGKIYTVPLAAHGPPDATGGAKAVALYQAALMVDGRNYLAANELGVLLAGFGRLPEARAALLHSLSASSQPIVWQNLSAVHKAMGEADLAARASKEGDLAANRLGQAAATAYDVRWVDPETFARAKPIDADPVNSTANSTSNAPSPSKNVAGSASWGAGRK
ncbi:MAG TPA: hypothetical protein VGH32_02630 [Pirellulales bacterium]